MRFVAAAIAFAIVLSSGVASAQRTWLGPGPPSQPMPPAPVPPMPAPASSCNLAYMDVTVPHNIIYWRTYSDCEGDTGTSTSWTVTKFAPLYAESCYYSYGPCGFECHGWYGSADSYFDYLRPLPLVGTSIIPNEWQWVSYDNTQASIYGDSWCERDWLVFIQP